ncbi:hypothetical protein MNBD_GAMMA01-1159 [hydrothermal vent metagenome]|uniref:Uncharacterized protein n=1 Tax=hydrothermal vent metagenome TaxID=652676 RepID=A0A3B0V4W1_9ZZZZ
MKKLIFILSTFLLSSQINAGLVAPPQLLYVGQGGGVCTYATIQDAIDNASSNSEIRVSNEIAYFENLQIDKGLTINGGYTNCEQAALGNRLDDSRTTIDANSITNVVVLTSEISINFNMSGFNLINGSTSYGGAVNAQTNNSIITFEQMNITDNISIVGGGIYLGGTDNELVLSNTKINNNTANLGGGVYCDNGSINLNDNSGIYQNNAVDMKTVGNGGGIFGANCSIYLRSGEGGMADSHTVGISNNQATGSGGGIYLEEGSIGAPLSGVANIDHNIANSDMDDTGGDGGGVYMTNGAYIDFSRLFFNGNTAFNGNGGAVFMDDSYYRDISNIPGYYNLCILLGFAECALFINNQALGDGLNLGGAIYMQNNSTGHVLSSSLRARFINNRADGGAAIAVYSGSTLDVQNSYFIGNGNNGDDATNDFNVIRVNGAGSEIDVSFSTFANNLNSYVFALFNDGQARLNKSIVFEEDPLTHLVTSPIDSAAFAHDCTLFHEGVTIGPLPGLSTSLVTTNPDFVNPATNNYQLMPSSAAIDRCNNTGLNPDVTIGVDYDGDERPIDIANTDNLVGAFDAGADEYDNDLIFINGFE